jgi:isoquinoline 1-oxidoreductase alpha subunit
MAVFNLRVNGERMSVDVAPEMPLLWALRDHLNLTGTKYSCGIAFCGSCTVLLDGEPIRSCATSVESVGEGEQAAALLEKNPHPSDDEIDEYMAGNLCRCGTYLRIRKAIRRVEEGRI